MPKKQNILLQKKQLLRKNQKHSRNRSHSHSRHRLLQTAAKSRLTRMI